MRYIRSRSVVLVGSFVIALTVNTQPANADTIFNTFGPGDSYNPNFRYGVNGDAEFQAFRFVPTSSGTLTSITVALGRTGTDPITRFQLYAGTFPPTTLGVLLETFDVPNMVTQGPPGAVVSFSSALNPVLTAGQNYWLSITEPGPPTPSFSLWFDNNRFIFGTRITETLLAHEAALPAFRVDAVPVQEPSSLLLLVAGSALVFRVRK
jgi:hypothetical protein